MQLEMINCPACNEDRLPVKRKELGYHVCVDCSTIKPLVGITTVEGSGDHTYNDIIIMDQERATAIAQAEAAITGKKVFMEVLDLDKDENEVTQSVKEAVDNVLNDEESDIEDALDPNKEHEGIQGIDY